ncbi:Asp23/Gls24 family envelope stress response protein [Mycoplasma sp. 480]|uniref:Asp23/Gls24 family envelope stress response protein n=1 Tax=Mycoplasma sp. 480 TaxID=3440155 RepID=UPI003F51979D
MVEELRNQLLEKISLIPGIYGFCNINTEANVLAKALKREEWEKSIFIIKGNNGLKINLAIILLFSVSVKTAVEEIKSVIEYHLQKNELKLETLNIHIKGIK